MDACPGGQAVQDRKRGYNMVQRAVHIIQRVADGEGVGTRRMTGVIHKTVETVLQG